MMETVISTLVVGLTVSGALQAVGAVVARRERVADRAAAAALAEELVTAALATPFVEPGTDALSAITSGAAEDAAAYWGSFDDFDDWQGWSASPPQSSDGVGMTGYAGWTRSAVVEFVVPGQPDTVSASPTRVKRLIVTVARNGIVRAERSVLRTAGYSEGSP